MQPWSAAYDSMPAIPRVRYSSLTSDPKLRRYMKPNIRKFVNAGESEGMRIFKNTPSKPYYLLEAKDLDMMLYYHKKYLQQMRENKLKADTDQTSNQCKPVFFTNVDIDTIDEKVESDIGEMEKPGDSDDRRGVRSVQNLRPHRRQLADKSESHFKQSSMNNLRKEKQPHWVKKKNGPKFLLDFRRNKPEREQFGDVKEENAEKQKDMYRNYPQANRATYFIPKLRGPRNPQLAKIEAYFV